MRRSTGLDGFADNAAFQVAYPDSTLAAAQAARTLLRRLEMGVIDVGEDQLALDTTNANRSLIAWGKAVTQSPTSEAIRALRILLARNPSLTTAQILNPASVSDATIATAIEALVPQLSLGAERR